MSLGQTMANGVCVPAFNAVSIVKCLPRQRCVRREQDFDGKQILFSITGTTRTRNRQRERERENLKFDAASRSLDREHSSPYDVGLCADRLTLRSRNRGNGFQFGKISSLILTGREERKRHLGGRKSDFRLSEYPNEYS